MKRVIAVTLVVAQIGAAAQPALAADLVDERGAVAQRQGSFAGARLRIPLDGTGGRKTQAGLTVAPVLQGGHANGGRHTRFGEGVELRLSGAASPQLTVGGRSLAQLAESRSGPDGRKAGISTAGWIAIGLGTVALLFAALYLACTPSTNCIDDGDG